MQHKGDMMELLSNIRKISRPGAEGLAKGQKSTSPSNKIIMQPPYAHIKHRNKHPYTGDPYTHSCFNKSHTSQWVQWEAQGLGSCHADT